MKTNKLLNPLSLFFVGLFLGTLSGLFDMYYPNLGEIFSQMSVWILLGTLIVIYSPTKKAETGCWSRRSGFCHEQHGPEDFDLLI